MEFETSIVILFKEYFTINDLIDVTDGMMKKWKQDIIDNFSNEYPVNIIMELFKIPKNYKKQIEDRQYNINIIKYEIDSNNKTICFHILLKIK